jgi:hypothetical protein
VGYVRKMPDLRGRQQGIFPLCPELSVSSLSFSCSFVHREGDDICGLTKFLQSMRQLSNICKIDGAPWILQAMLDAEDMEESWATALGTQAQAKFVYSNTRQVEVSR